MWNFSDTGCTLEEFKLAMGKTKSQADIKKEHSFGTDFRYKDECKLGMGKAKNQSIDTDFRLKGYGLGLGKTKAQTNTKLEQSVDFEVQSSLKQEILQLEKRLKDQLGERHVLEQALGYRSSAIDSTINGTTPKLAKGLIREIAILELEVMHLEQYLLSLYRKAFDQQSTLSPASIGEKSKQMLRSKARAFQEVAGANNLFEGGKQGSVSQRIHHPRNLSTDFANVAGDTFAGPGVHRCHSALSYRSARMSPPPANLTRVLESFHSQPLTYLEDGQNAAQGIVSLAEYLGSNIADHVPETPNKISENMVRCMGAIYYKLVDPPLVNHGLSSPTSSFSSISALSPQYLGDIWSPGYRKEPILDSRLINPFRVEGLKEFSGPYNSMVEVPFICWERQRLGDIQDLMRSYKSLVDQLESVSLRRMKNEEKLAFWINVHNAMIMHAYLDHGIPQSNTKKQSLPAKAAYTISSRLLSAETIRETILGCHTHCPKQWLRILLSPKLKFKSRDEWQGHTLDRPEPLLHFALCSGSHSDPAVRIYTPKKLYQQLEAAKEEYIRAAIGIQNEHKIILPKIVDYYAKDKGLSSQGLVEMIQRYLPENLQKVFRKLQQGKSHHKIIEWIPHDLTFRYLLSRELVVAH
ncbi:uncharacterized protein LOC120266668 [Dioscorea cayenensis subsp. rotundata]|uniref:Uncharacterized protein LOC120266668 n=1 Tax=Dioscorea cayennensis subsp. rotundata TaxID=55577 RepID=A0AB40BS09_DIOCR|nr:uncharacterized protein LOC120266668 [Dioscorea cayenensis subsp. rotundata]XP_039130242.1 uncharacterized protein LOC120266668 [Dioscorea cayenensis subsp. rotundata]